MNINWFNFIIGLLCLTVSCWMIFWKYKQKFWWNFYFIIELIIGIINIIIAFFGKTPEFWRLYI
jgi:hypothetical protein